MTKRTCSVEGCNKPHKGHGYCEMHLDRMKKYGTTELPERKRKVCAVTGCDKYVNNGLLCELHNDRLERTGDIHLKPPQRQFIEDHSDATHDDCILWPYSKNVWGYGKVDQTTAHRLMCLRAHGPAPDGKPCVLHSCGNRACVNPNHLRWGTIAENQQDMVDHGMSLQGVKHHKAKLDDDAVRDIRRRAANQSQASLAQQYGVSANTISKVVRRLSWSHIK